MRAAEEVGAGIVALGFRGDVRERPDDDPRPLRLEHQVDRLLRGARGGRRRRRGGRGRRRQGSGSPRVGPRSARAGETAAGLQDWRLRGLAAAGRHPLQRSHGRRNAGGRVVAPVQLVLSGDDRALRCHRPDAHSVLRRRRDPRQRHVQARLPRLLPPGVGYP
ncbi:unnamed protein product, partial [Laminaria digitata]